MRPSYGWSPVNAISLFHARDPLTWLLSLPPATWYTPGHLGLGGHASWKADLEQLVLWMHPSNLSPVRQKTASEIFLVHFFSDCKSKPRHGRVLLKYRRTHLGITSSDCCLQGWYFSVFLPICAWVSLHMLCTIGITWTVYSF